MPTYTTLTEWQPDADDHFLPLRCVWCAEPGDGEEPCSEGCERIAVQAARMRRVRGAVEAVARATQLLVQYRSEGGVFDPRIAPLIEEIAEHERTIRVATEAVEKEVA
jgi:hypothetical protein